MTSPRGRRTRLVVCLVLATLLAGALVYTSFSASTEAAEPSQVLAAPAEGKRFDVTGRVAAGSVSRDGDRLRFIVRDRTGTASLPVDYTGTVPDPFREGREVIVSGVVRRGRLVAERDSLITKCPSKFSAA